MDRCWKKAMMPAGLALLLAVLLSGPATGQAPRVIAIADFVDESASGFQIDAPGLSAELALLIDTRAAGRLRVASVAELRNAIRTRGLTASDLVSPARAAEIALALGANLIVTGRWTHLEAETTTKGDPAIIPREGLAALEVRVLEVPSRRVILRDSFQGIAAGGGRIGVLRRAAFIALTMAADRISRL